METWFKTSLILCVFGFLKEFRPSEPFITPYLTSYKNFTEEQVNQEIYPVGTYSYLCLLVVVFLVTDLLRYKPVIILLGVMGITTWSLLIWGTDIPAMQALEFTYGVFMAAEVAYFTYIYAQVEPRHYQKVTSHTRAAFLLGRFLSGVVSQTLVSTEVTGFYELNFITLAAECVATVWAFLLPPVKHSLYFHRSERVDNYLSEGVDNHATSVETTNNLAETLSDSTAYVIPNPQRKDSSPSVNGIVRKFMTAYKYLWRDFMQAFSNLYVVKWSIWWAVATCGFLQTLTYTQMLWEAIAADSSGEGEERADLYNGAIEAAYTLIGAGAALACGWLKLEWQVVGEMALALCSALQGVTLLVSSVTTSLWLAYCMYILFGVLYHTMITIANSEVAKYINEDSYGLIFGVNTFFALVLQSILTAVVVSTGGFALGTRMQFKVYGSYFLIMGGIFFVTASYTLCSRCLRLTPEPVMVPKASLNSL